MLFWKKQQLLVFVAAGLLVVHFIFFGSLPLRRRLEVIGQTRAALELNIANTAAQEKQLPLLREELLTLQRAVGNYEANLPTDPDLGIFLQQIANLMGRHELTEQVVAPGTEVKTDVLNCIPVSMQCKGKLTQIFEFYKQLQQLDRLVRIESVKLTNDNDLSGQASMHTRAVVYYRPAAEAGKTS